MYTSTASALPRWIVLGICSCGILIVGGRLLADSQPIPSQKMVQKGLETTAQAEHSQVGSPPATDHKISPQSSHAPGHLLSELFRRLGPWAVFLLMLASGAGLHFPEDLVVIPAGWEIATGQFPLLETFLAAYLGVVGGDAGWFLLCRVFGSKLLGTRWFLKTAHPRRILEIKALFDRFGFLVLLVARFVPGARTPSIAVAGLMHLRWSIFFCVQLPMTLLSVSAQLALGYFAGEGFLHISHRWHTVTIAVGFLIVIALVVGGLLVHRQMAKGTLRLPRAKVAWLRELRGGSRAAGRRTRAVRIPTSP